MKLIKLLPILFIFGCTNADRANISSLGSDATVRLYSGGELVGEWVSDGKVMAEDSTDGWRFKDKTTGMFIRVTGDTVVIN